MLDSPCISRFILFDHIAADIFLESGYVCDSLSEGIGQIQALDEIICELIIGNLVDSDGKDNILAGNIRRRIVLRELQIQIQFFTLFCTDQAILESFDEGAGTDDQIVVSAAAFKFFPVDLSDIINIDGIPFLDLAVDFLESSVTLQDCLDPFLYILIRGILGFRGLYFLMFISIGQFDIIRRFNAGENKTLSVFVQSAIFVPEFFSLERKASAPSLN